MNIGIVTSFYNHYDRFLPTWAQSIVALEIKPSFVSMVASGKDYDPQNIQHACDLFEKYKIPHTVDYIDHKGMGVARNKAVENSPTEYIMYLDVDDVILPKAINHYRKYHADVISGGLVVEQTNGVVKNVKFNATQKRALEGQWVSCSHGVYRKKFWQLSPYITHNDYVDQCLWLGFAQQGAEFVGTQEMCTVYKRRADGHNLTMTDDMRAEQKAMWRDYVKNGVYGLGQPIYYYTSESNFGDLLTPIIVKWATGQDVRLANENHRGKIVSLGSVMSKVRPQDVVWGTGIIDGKEFNLNNVKILSVRGPLTRSKIKGVHVPAVYGDPALLMPRIYQPKIEKQHRVGILSHYVDVERFDVKNYLWIDVTNPNVYETIDKMVSCDVIVSTSLHGLIVADAYNVPCVWLSVGDKIRGGVFKFHDYLLSTGREQLDPIRINRVVTDEDIEEIIQHPLPKPIIDTEPMLRALKDYQHRRENIKLSVTVMAHPKREEWAKELQSELNAHIEWDNGVSVWETAKRAWLSYDPQATHHMVIQDDAIISQDLIKTLEKAIKERPNDIITPCTIAYKMTSRDRMEYERLYRHHQKWFVTQLNLSGVAIIIPTDIIEEMVEYCDTLPTPHDDKKILQFAKDKQMAIYNTVPSLVDHRPPHENPSLMSNHDLKTRGNRQALIFIGKEQQ